MISCPGVLIACCCTQITFMGKTHLDGAGSGGVVAVALVNVGGITAAGKETLGGSVDGSEEEGQEAEGHDRVLVATEVVAVVVDAGERARDAAVVGGPVVSVDNKGGEPEVAEDQVDGHEPAAVSMVAARQEEDNRVDNHRQDGNDQSVDEVAAAIVAKDGALSVDKVGSDTHNNGGSHPSEGGAAHETQAENCHFVWCVD